MSSGLAIWASLLATLVLVVIILAALFGMNSVVLIIAVVGAVIMGVSGLFLLRKLAG
jgi:hypothetical protein